MSHIVITYELDDTTASNYNYDSNKIEFTSSGAKLKLVDFPSQTYTQPFTSSTGFTFDAAKTEFVAGKCQQKDKAPANSVCWATYTSSTDLSYIASGDATATITGSPVIANNRFECYGGVNENAIYNNSNIGTIQDTGTVRKKWTAGYSGGPAANTTIFQLGDATNNNKFIFFHALTGNTLRISAWDSTGTPIHTAAIIGAPFLPTAGNTYEFSVNFTASTGVIEVYIDGVYQGATPATTFTRTGTNYLYIGAGTTYAVADGAYEDVILYDTVQHSGGAGGNYTPGYTLEERRYLEDLITNPNFTYAGLGTTQSFDGFTTTQTGLIRMNVNGEYWTGSAWASSDDSYAQMNDPATINTNISALTAADTVSIKMRTQDVNIQMDIDVLNVEYTGQHYPTDNPTIEIKSGVSSDGIHGWHEDDVTIPSGATLKYVLPRAPAYWWSGAAWVSSNETYAQSNTSSEISTNIGSLDITAGNTVKFLAFLNSDGTVTPTIKTLRLEYDFYAILPLPAHTVVYGQCIDLGQNVLSGSIISVKSYNPFKHGDNIVIIDTSTTSDANGHFELDVIETETVGEEVFMEFEHTVGAETTTVRYDNIIIPNVTSVSIDFLLGNKLPNDVKYYKEGTADDANEDPLYLLGTFRAI
jgi:hypothetical protein